MSQLLLRAASLRSPAVHFGDCALRVVAARCVSGEAGSGAGKGGGGGGSIREAGGAFGKMEAAHEEQYFRKLQAEQIKKLKEHIEDEIKHHEAEIKRHQEAIKRHKKKKESLDD